MPFYKKRKNPSFEGKSLVKGINTFISYPNSLTKIRRGFITLKMTSKLDLLGAFKAAIKENHRDIAEYILNFSLELPTVWMTPGLVDKYIVLSEKHNLRVNPNDAAKPAVYHLRIDLINLFIKKGLTNFEELLDIAIRSNTTRMVRFFIEGWNIDYDINTALNHAIVNYNMELINLYLEETRPIDIDRAVMAATSSGYTDLAILFKNRTIKKPSYEHLSCIVSLINSYSNYNDIYQKISAGFYNKDILICANKALSVAVINNHDDLIELFLDSGACNWSYILSQCFQSMSPRSTGEKCIPMNILRILEEAENDGDEELDYYFLLGEAAKAGVSDYFYRFLSIVEASGIEFDLNDLLIYAVEGGNNEIIDFVVSKGPTYWSGAIIASLTINDREKVEFFLSKGPVRDEEWDTFLSNAVYYDNRDMANFIIKKARYHDFCWENIILMATTRPMADFLLEKIKAPNWNKLMLEAIQYGCSELAYYYIERGEKEGTKKFSWNHALEASALYDDRDLIIFLIRKKIEHKSENSLLSWDPLMEKAIFSKNRSLIHFLIHYPPKELKIPGAKNWSLYREFAIEHDEDDIVRYFDEKIEEDKDRRRKRLLSGDKRTTPQAKTRTVLRRVRNNVLRMVTEG